MRLAYVELGVFVAAIATGLIYQHWFLTKTCQLFRVASMLALCGLLGHAVYQVVVRDEAQEPVWADNARTWARVPLDVWWDRTQLADYNDGIEGAIRLWNKEVGCELLRPTAVSGLEAEAQVVILRNSEVPCGDIAKLQSLSKHDNLGTWLCPQSAEIYVKKLDWAWDAYKGFVHEFGHVLGLAHDPGGVMCYPTVTDLVVPNRKDIQALRARYCHAEP